MRLFIMLLAMAVSSGTLGAAHSTTADSKEHFCPFCDSVKQTLRQDMESNDAVAIGVLVPDPKAKEDDFSGVANFEIMVVIKGQEVISQGQVVAAPYFGSMKSSKRFLLQGVDPAQLVWTSPLPLTKASEEYLLNIPNLPVEPIERLKYFMKHLEHEDSLLARDAYDEFAISPYDQIKQLKNDLSRDQLLTWLTNNEISADRKRLYFTLLGICGTPEDADLLEGRMQSENADDRAGLDAMVACYLTLKGDAGLPLVEKLFLANKQSPYPDTYSAIQALRFHGTEGGVLNRDNVVKSVRLLLERPEMADLVIPDLAKWEDWSQIDKLVQLFKEADDSTWVRMPVVNYLRVCPLPIAKEKLDELEKIDPKTIQRAKTFFPIPSAAPGKKESSLNLPRPGFGPIFDVEGDPRWEYSAFRARSSVALNVQYPSPKSGKTETILNRSSLAIVSTLMAATLGMTMAIIVVR